MNKKSSICFKYLRGFRVNRGEDKVIAVHSLFLMHDDATEVIEVYLFSFQVDVKLQIVVEACGQ